MKRRGAAGPEDPVSGGTERPGCARERVKTASAHEGPRADGGTATRRDRVGRCANESVRELNR